MKKLILIAFVALAFTAVKAQQGLHIAFKVGPQSSWVFNSENSDDPNFRYISSWGMLIGPSFSYNFNGTVGVGMDFLFSKQGQKFYTEKAEINEAHLRLNLF